MKLHKKPGDSIMLASLQNPTKTNEFISYSCPNVLKILYANSYYCERKHNDAAAEGL